ncbi:MAG: HD domain-containing protein [Bacteroidaceae bacterium]|nr:HD domain-containing protein [Bacteroidaceae bacterium]
MPIIINDPVHGFIELPDGMLSQLARHRVLFRLSRIHQLGPTSYVYPGGRHTRFEHSIGAYHLAHLAVESLRSKGIHIGSEDAEAVEAAMLLHDIGHGPMSHALEGLFAEGISHEDITLLLTERLNAEMGGRLSMALSILRREHPLEYLNELVQSQLDMDRIDYLCRDSFFTGVREGSIGAARIIKMLHVAQDRLMVEWKGIYTIENYLMARRLMYWQVYLHKTAVAAQELLCMAVRRARQLAHQGRKVPASPALSYFLGQRVDRTHMQNHPEWLDNFVALDDNDLECALKQWMSHEDKTLSLLAKNYVRRNLYKVAETALPVPPDALQAMRRHMGRALGIGEEEAAYFVRTHQVRQTLYSSKDDHIFILQKDGSVRDISELSELLSSELVDKVCSRNFLFYQRDVEGFQPFLT